jgi:hypothetical protein
VLDRLPATEDELRELLDQGVLTEGHHLDFKREQPPGRKANTELAKDLAQLTLDGGALLIGVDDNDTAKPPQLTPVTLAGLKERIDQVARMLPEPPIHVHIDILRASTTETGYLLMVVAPDGIPRQVDGRYYGRGDTTRTVLSDAQVTRLHQLAAQAQRGVDRLLDEEIARDPTVPADGRQHAHLFVVAQPVLEQPERLQQVLGADGAKGWHEFLHRRVQSAPAGVRLHPAWTPDIPQLGTPTRCAPGWALSSDYILPQRTAPLDGGMPSIQDLEPRLLDMEINEDGGVRLFCARASAPRQFGGTTLDVAVEGVILGLTKRVVLIATVVAETTSYLGAWDFGIAITNLRGRQSLSVVQTGWEATPFSDDGYRQTTRATWKQLTTDPDAIVAELTGRLNRALGGAAPIPQ